MKIEFIKKQQFDIINIKRNDEQELSFTFPKKGWFPHDAVHFVVEKHLNFKNAFWGKVATGQHPEEIGALAKREGHASARRAARPGVDIIELLQAERLVECFEAELWGKPADFETFIATLKAACDQSQIQVPALSQQDLTAIRGELAELGTVWKQTHKLLLNWPKNSFCN